MGKSAEETRAPGEIGREPAVQPGEGGRGLGQHGLESGREERQAQERRDDRAGEGVARHGEERRCRKWSMRIGAVTPPHAIETARTVARPRGKG